MQLLELWSMAKLVVKQSAKAHGPLVYISRIPTGMASPSEQEKIPKAEIVCAQIRKNWRALVDDLDPLDLLDIWLEKEIINTGDKQRIRNEITDQNKARKALEIITSRGGRTVLLFLESLKENWNHLSEKIVTTEVDTAKLPDAASADSYYGNWCFTINERYTRIDIIHYTLLVGETTQY